MSEADVLYVPDMARKLGRTEAAIRTAIERDRLRGSRKKSLPPPFKLGGKWAWRRADFEAWLAEKAGATAPRDAP